MLEYPSIPNSSKAPRAEMIAWDKKDGSNFRIKYTPKQGFCLFGTRTQLIDENTAFWSKMVAVFREKYEKDFLNRFKSKDYRDYREVIVFGEFGGPNSFAGRHDPEDKYDITFFDILLGHKQRKLLLPQDFLADFGKWTNIPEVIYRGKLNDDFIKSVRENKELKEGVICKGTERRGDAFGGVWMCKIKTQAYFDRLQKELGTEWKKYWE